jgi:hypothetical protein
MSSQRRENNLQLNSKSPYFLHPTERMRGRHDLFLERDAVISDCGKYRYLLRRTWDHDKPQALIIMLNPSTADAETDDATIRSCIRLTKAAGYGSFEVVNLYGLRATDPKELFAAYAPIGPRNEIITVAAIGRCDTAICAWGAHRMAVGQYLLDRIRCWRTAAYCWGVTKSGAPRHPLYVKTGTPLEVYRR